jgi:hypothetical protein
MSLPPDWGTPPAAARLAVYQPSCYTYAMVIEQIVDIPADRPFLDLKLPLPANHPFGTVRVEVSLKPEKKSFFRSLFSSKFSRNFDTFYGCLKDTDAFKGDSVEIVRAMRDEWDRPWDKNG